LAIPERKIAGATIMTTLSAQMPGSDRAGIMPPTPHDPKVETLRAMFPDIDADVLASMLAFSNGSVEDACAAILDVAPAVEDTDAAMARVLQQELDAEVARSVQDDLNKVAEAERAAALAKDPTVRAAKAVESAASSTLSMLKKASARTLTAVGARKAAPSSTHGVRLLEASTGDERSDVAFNFSPLQVPDYVPTALSVPEPPAVQAPAQSSLVDVSDAAEWGPATTTPATTDSASTISAGDRYSSRLDRARRSNAASNRSASISLSSSPPAGPAATPHVPVGELI